MYIYVKKKAAKPHPVPQISIGGVWVESEKNTGMTSKNKYKCNEKSKPRTSQNRKTECTSGLQMSKESTSD